MSAKKQITIDVPDGLPDGWECCGYGAPVVGETMHHGLDGWMKTGESEYDQHGDPCDYLIARRTETAADWANKQPKLRALAGMVLDDTSIAIYTSGRHAYEDEVGARAFIHAEKCYECHHGTNIVASNGKWVDA